MTEGRSLGAGSLVGEAAVPQGLGVLQQMFILLAAWSLPAHSSRMSGAQKPLQTLPL